MAGLTLPPAQWRTRAGLDRLLAALDAEGGAARFVGGAVRDTLLGLDVHDVDVATRLRPEAVVERLRAAGIKPVPTGIAHGTVTAVLPGWTVEITTLRRDVSTDGRRATVAFSDDWREDAARRDFTINALYAEPASGEVFDYFEGAADLDARRVRFIGDPLTRIAEDHLRILRFFRFHARFGQGAPDAEGLAACAARANDLMALSRERIADELLKLLALPDPAPTIALMIERGILAPVLPEIETVDRLLALQATERATGAPAESVRRLSALLPPAAADTIAARLRLSNADRKRIARALEASGASTSETLYRHGRAAAEDRLLLAGGDASNWRALAETARPALPISGGALVERGMVAGPSVAATLARIERRWIEEHFPAAERVARIADEEVAQALRDARNS